MGYIPLIADYAYISSFLIFIVSSIFIFKGGYKSPALLMGISSISVLVITAIANATYSPGLVETVSENGASIFRPAYNFWSAIQYPSNLLAIAIISVSVLILSIQVANKHVNKQ